MYSGQDYYRIQELGFNSVLFRLSKLKVFIFIYMYAYVFIHLPVHHLQACGA